MQASEKIVERAAKLLGLRCKDFIELPRPGYLAQCHVPGPAAEIGKPLRFDKMNLLFDELCLDRLALLDFGLQRSDRLREVDGSLVDAFLEVFLGASQAPFGALACRHIGAQ